MRGKRPSRITFEEYIQSLPGRLLERIGFNALTLISNARQPYGPQVATQRQIASTNALPQVFRTKGLVNCIKELEPRVLKKRFSSRFVLKQVKPQSTQNQMGGR